MSAAIPLKRLNSAHPKGVDGPRQRFRRWRNTMTTRMLQDKIAVVFGAGGSIGAAVAKEFAAEGARVFLAGRTKTNVEKVAKEITVGGGRAHAAPIDAINGGAVSEYIEDIAKRR